jgi:HEAT repeats
MEWGFIIVAAATLLWYGYRHPYRRRWLLPRPAMPRLTASAVDRQHRHLLAGGLVGESAVVATAAHFDELLRAGRTAEVERELQPGVGFAIQVRALTAVGTNEAGQVLERQLGRTLSRDLVEQMWYWADVVAALRHLHHVPALPAVLRCADAAAGLPAGSVLAAEAVAFPNFPTTLNDLTSPIGRAALRAIVVVSRCCRNGSVAPAGMLRAGLGDLLATVSETAPVLPDPWLTEAMLEAARLARRCRLWVRFLDCEDRVLAERQGSRLRESTSRRSEWLGGASDRLVTRFPIASAEEQAAILRCGFELRADVTGLFPHLPDRRAVWWGDAIRCLTWSKSPAAGPVLAGQAARWLTNRRRRLHVAALLTAVRGHSCPEAENTLVEATSSADREIRRAATSSLGWWSPFDPEGVLRALRALRTDPDDSTRNPAVSALARLGERAALNEIRAGLSAEETAIRVATSARIAEEELSWLWPDVQELAESPDVETAVAATEAAEHLRECALGPIG